MSVVFSRRLNYMTHHEITRSALGNDTDGEIALGSDSRPTWMSLVYPFLPLELANKISDYSNQISFQSLAKFRNAISTLAFAVDEEGKARAHHVVSDVAGADPHRPISRCRSSASCSPMPSARPTALPRPTRSRPIPISIAPKVGTGHSRCNPLCHDRCRQVSSSVSETRIEIAAPDSEDACWCLEAYFRELSARVDGGFDPAKTTSVSTEDMTPPVGYFLIARMGGKPVGCAVLRVRDGAIGEIKRMWVDASVRRSGVGRRLIATLETMGRNLHLRALRLDTNGALKEAHALYRKCGFIEVAPFNDEPYAHHWFEKPLA